MEIKTEIKPTDIDIKDPAISLLSMSLPKRSVPNKNFFVIILFATISCCKSATGRTIFSFVCKSKIKFPFPSFATVPKSESEYATSATL